MSLDRRDIRAKLDHDVHAALGVLCQAEGVEIAQYIERLVVNDVSERVHAATLVADGLRRLGISGITREPARRAPDAQSS